jgi:TatD DNase family protein
VIDFHCHLDLYPDPELEVSEADAAGIYILSVTTTPKAWSRTATLAKGKKRIRTALGLHPELAHQRRRELPLFEALLPNTRYVGEIGLDGSPDFKAHREDQRQVLETILQMCTRADGRVLTIHSRRAVDDVLDCLSRFPAAGIPILHWFSGTPTQLQRAIGMGCWFSVGPAMLRSSKGKSIAELIPRSRVLTETDGPFGKLENRALKPVDSWTAVDQLAEIWCLPMDEVADLLLGNLRALGSAGLKPEL